MTRIGILGGTFDPIHTGHLVCAAEAREAFCLDEVLFVPTAQPSFKAGQQIGSASDRMNMCRLAVEGNPTFSVSDVDIRRGGTTYTVDTLRDLHELYAKSPSSEGSPIFVFITGSDAGVSVPRWKDPEAIAELAELGIMVRPGTSVEPDDLKRLQELGFTVQCARATQVDISSTDIRARIADGRDARYLMPAAVMDYIVEHGLYGSAVTGAPVRPTSLDPHEASDAAFADDPRGKLGPFDEDFFAYLEERVATRVRASRLDHILGVRDTAVQLAEVYGVDPQEARLAGLLHDWDKGYSDDEIRARADRLGLSFPEDVYWKMAQTIHGETAAEALHREFPQIPPQVIQAISRHTSCAVDMTPLDMVLYLADALEPNRRFGRISELRGLIGELDLEDLFVEVDGYWITLILERHKTMHPLTMDVWNHYASRYWERHGLKPRLER